MMEEMEAFDAGANGVLTIYRYHSDYIKNRFTVFLIKGHTMVELELFGSDVEKMLPQVHALKELAQTVRIDKPDGDLDYSSLQKRAINGDWAVVPYLLQASPTLGGDASRAHSALLGKLLLRYGDRTFSTFLAPHPANVRNKVVHLLDDYFQRSWSADFPLTYKIAEH
jgi:hypothetical protein